MSKGTSNKLSGASIRWAIRHILHQGDTDIFPLPFEFKVIGSCRKNVVEQLSQVDSKRSSCTDFLPMGPW